VLILWLPLLLVMSQRGINYLGVPLSEHSTQASQLLLVDRWLAVTGFLLDGLATYFGVVPLLAAAGAMLAAVILRPRQGLVLAMAVGGPVIAVIAAGDLGASLRYWLNVIPLALAWTAGGLVVLGQRLAGQRGGQLIPLALVGVWIVLFATPFIQTAYENPAALVLPDKDRLEYLEADSAGTMLPELAAFLTAENARLGGDLVVTGAISQCAGLALYLPPDSGIQMGCPRIFSDEGRGAALDEHIRALSAEYPHYVVIFEDPGLVPVGDIVSIRLDTLAHFPRPGGRVTLTVYQPVRP
ncbi:MAG: hypothetical protein K8J31_19540, partial [Anaerolineae bacterium]|nr:hypothetical protein [Anaerolineae bacterium]